MDDIAPPGLLDLKFHVRRRPRGENGRRLFLKDVKKSTVQLVRGSLRTIFSGKGEIDVSYGTARPEESFRGVKKDDSDRSNFQNRTPFQLPSPWPVSDRRHKVGGDEGEGSLAG